jgi:hypothetical protein
LSQESTLKGTYLFVSLYSVYIPKVFTVINFLSFGTAFRLLVFSFKMAETAVRNIVCGAYMAIQEVFCTKHILFPATTVLFECVEEFYKKWHFPSCFGCINEKHVHL